MTTLNRIIKAIKALDFQKAIDLLPEGFTCYGIPKPIFFETLANTLKSKYPEVVQFNQVVDGICTCDCCNYKESLRFISNNDLALDFYFKLENNQITDIRLCHAFKTNDDELQDLQTIYFYCYKDDNVNFRPNAEYKRNKHLVKDAMEDYLILIAFGDPSIEQLREWRDKHSFIIFEFENEIPFVNGLFRAFHQFEMLVTKVNSIINNS